MLRSHFLIIVIRYIIFRGKSARFVCVGSYYILLYFLLNGKVSVETESSAAGWGTTARTLKQHRYSAAAAAARSSAGGSAVAGYLVAVAA